MRPALSASGDLRAGEKGASRYAGCGARCGGGEPSLACVRYDPPIGSRGAGRAGTALDKVSTGPSLHLGCSDSMLPYDALSSLL